MGFCLMISFMGFSMRLGDGGRGVDDKSGVSYGFGILLSKISNLIFDSSLQNFRPEFVHHSCSRASGQGNFRFAQFLILNTRLALHLMCLFAQDHSGFDFYHIASTMVFNFLNSNLCALILKDWIKEETENQMSKCAVERRKVAKKKEKMRILKRSP